MSEAKKVASARDDGSGESSPRNYNERHQSVASSQAARVAPPTTRTRATTLRGTDQGLSSFTTTRSSTCYHLPDKKSERRNDAEEPPVKHASVAPDQAANNSIPAATTAPRMPFSGRTHGYHEDDQDDAGSKPLPTSRSLPPKHRSSDGISSRPNESPRKESKVSTTDQTTITEASPFSTKTACKPPPSASREGWFQEEGLGDLKPSAVPHSLQQDDLNKATDVAAVNNFHKDVSHHDDDSVDDKKPRRDLALASRTPVYQLPRGAAAVHDEHPNFHDIETAVGDTEPRPTTTTQAPLPLPGAFREGGGFHDDEETRVTAPEQNTVPPSQSGTQDNVIAEAELVGNEPEPDLVIADIAEEKWWYKRRNVCILIAAIAILLLGIYVAVLAISGGGSSGGDNSADEDNDICSNAIPLSIPSSINGSTLTATLDDVGADTLCEPNTPGVWYTVVGTGNNIDASTCNGDTSYSTAISVFRGRCDVLQCVAHNDYGRASLCETSSGLQSRAVWTSNEGETYLILVHGNDEVGNFLLNISHVDENDVCEDAIPLSVPFSIKGSTMNATLDDVGANTTCEPNARGIWYTVVGTGNNMIASTCNEDTSYNTEISVFKGGCSGLQCMAHNDFGGLESCRLSTGARWGSRAIWTSIEGETYSVLVHGSFDLGLSAVGDFRLDLVQVDPVENDVCEDAIPLSIPSSIQGSTINAIIDTDLPCGRNTPGVWYSVVGTGNNITASLCNEDTTFDTYLAVFRGSCSSLECVVENDKGDGDSCEDQSRLRWMATGGVTYYVLVQGVFDAIGDFRLDVPVKNDICDDAVPLSIPSSIQGSTINATLDEVGAGTLCEPNARGIWYTVVGTGNNIIASTCNEDTSYDMEISVFRGGCSGLQCVAHNDYGGLESCSSSSGSGSRVVWTTIEGEIYSVLVHGSLSRVGNFRLDLSQADVENDVCEDATPLSIPSSIQGSTLTATLDDVGTNTTCEPDVPGIWYTVVGTGNNMIASTCNEDTSYFTEISVFRGGCSGLECVAHNDNGPESLCGNSFKRPSRAVWTSIEGETYSVLVHGYDGEVGDFGLDISQVDPVENDVCEDAIRLSIPSSIQGSTMSAGHEYVGGAGTVCEADAPGIWYTVVGTGNNIIASTCNEDTSYDTEISVFRGGCNGLQCVAHNNYGGLLSCSLSPGSRGRAVWTSIEGETYSVLVHGSFGEVGNFRLDISQVDQVENDVCEDATPLSVPSSIQGSTINATTDTDLSWCGGFEPGVWYSIVGTGNNIAASLCNEDTTFDTYLTVFRGSCSSLECVVDNNNIYGDSCGLQSRVSWTATGGVTYYVLVQGWFEIGDFRLDVVEE